MNQVVQKLGWIVVTCTGILLCAPAGAARTQIATSGKKHVQLVELFSSESCSSCPPADDYVSTLRDRTGLWTRFVPVVFHVDYWNHLNWKDEYSSEPMTRRQQAHAAGWPRPAVYTPGFVLDGKEWRGWRESTLPRDESPSSVVLSIFKDEDGSYSVSAEGLKKGTNYTIRIAKLGMGLVTKVATGENGGSTLKHNFLVLDWKSNEVSLKTTASAMATVSFKLDADSKKKPTQTAIVAWIETTGSPTPLQATGAYL